MIEEEKSRQEKPPCYDEEDGYDNIGNGRHEITLEFSFEYICYLRHVSPLWSIREIYFQGSVPLGEAPAVPSRFL